MKHRFRISLALFAALSMTAPALALGARAQKLVAQSGGDIQCGTVTAQARLVLSGSFMIIPCAGGHPGWN